MLDFLEKARRFLWLFVELMFLAVLAIVLIYLILGPSSGAFVVSVVGNVTGFAGAIPAPSFIGIALILAARLPHSAALEVTVPEVLIQFHTRSPAMCVDMRACARLEPSSVVMVCLSTTLAMAASMRS